MQKNYQKIYKTSIILVLICSFLINPFRVFADSTYINILSGDAIYAIENDNMGYRTYFGITNNVSEVRYTFILNQQTNKYLIACVSLNQFQYGSFINTNISYSNASSRSLNGNNYYYGSSSSTANNSSSVYNYLVIDNELNDSNTFQKAVYYTYGEGAVGPVEPVSMGDLVTGFYTQFATRGNNDDSIIAMRLNKDTITWDTTDTLGNDLSGILWVVDIRAIPVQYSSATKNNLLLQTISDVLLSTDTYDITTISASQGQFSITWGDLVDNYLENFGSLKQLFAMFNESEWIQKGWIYQVRLRSLSEDRPYEGEWQTVYNTTSSAPSDAQTIMNYYYYTNGNGLNPGVVNSIQNINTTNNTTNNWYVDDQEIDTDPDHSWIEKLIEALVSLVQSILDFFKGIFDGLVDLLLGLLDGFDPVGSFMGWWSDLLNGFNGIDLTLPEFNLPEIEGIESLSILPQKTIELFTNNGLGIVIFVPLILMILRLFL